MSSMARLKEQLNAPIDLDSLEPIEIPFELRGKQYLLREADGETAKKYKNAGFRAAKMSDGKVTGVDGLADAELILIQGCMFEVTGARSTEPNQWRQGLGAIAAGFVGTGITHRVGKLLFSKAREISDLGEEETEETLNKEIARLQERLVKLREGKGLPGPKDIQASTDITSE